MDRKMKKILLFIAIFFIGTIPTMAREVNFKELNAAVEEKGATWYYVVGEYVFTSTYGQKDNTKLSIQDFMLGARTIAEADGAIKGDNIYDAMTINYVKKDGSEWKIQNNYLGKTDLKQKLSATDDNKKINIKYIDYEIFKTPTAAKLDLGYGESSNNYQTLIETTYGFTGGNAANSENLKLASNGTNQYTLTGLLKRFDGTLNNVFQGEDLTKYYFSYYVDFENKDLVTDDSTITIKALNQQGSEKTTSTKTFAKKNFDSDTGIAMLFAYKPTSEYQKLEITLDYDGEKEIYAPTTYTIDLSKLRIQEESNLTMNKEIPQADLATFADWKYQNPDTVTYDYSKETNTLTLGGVLAPQEIDNTKAKFPTEEAKGYYVLVNFNSEDFIPGKTTIKMQKGESTKTLKDEIDATGVSVLIALDPDAVTKTITVTVDLDGEGNQYYGKDYTINWEGLTLEKKTEIKVEEGQEFTDDLETIDTNVADKLNIENWDKESIEKVSIKQTGATAEITGVLPKTSEVEGITNKTGYYVPVVITLSENYKENETTVTVSYNNSKMRAIALESNITLYDDTKILIFQPLEEDKTSFDVIVDLDGEKTEYAPYTITFDYSKLTLQKATVMSDTDVQATIPEGTDKDHFENVYGYEFKDELKVTREGNVFKITGDVHEQEISKDVFTGDEVTNFYIPYNINPTGAIKGKTTVTRPIKQGTENPVSTINDDYGLSVLLSIQPDKVANCKEEPNNCQFEFTVDLDGSEEQYTPSKFIIDYSGVNLVKYIKATFENPKSDATVIKLYSGETIAKEKVTTPEYDKYHEFVKWTIGDTDTEFKFGETTITQDTNIKPNWKVLVNEYVNDKVSSIVEIENYNKPTIEGTDITLNITKNNVSKDKLSDILVPIISEVLKTNEIEKVTLKLGEETSVDITSSEDIKNNIENTLLSGKDDLDDLIAKTITISFEKKANTLVEFDKKEDYNLKFTADFRVVKNESDLTNALAASEVKTIYVTEGFTVESEHEINRNITISGTDSKNTITSNGQNSVFKVTSGEVTFDNIKLTGAKVGILANTGTVTLNNIDLSDNTEAGMELNGRVTLKGDKSKITYTNEAYEKPLIRIPKTQKNNHTIEVTGLTKVDTLYDVKKFDKNSGYDAEQDVYIGDELVAKNYDYINHYLDATKSNKWLRLVYIADRTITNKPVVYTVYFDKEKGVGEGNNAEPDKDIKYLTTFDGTLGTYTVDKWSSGGNTYNYGEVNPTKDGSYGIIYKVEYKAGTVEVGDEQSLINAVKADSNNKIVIVKNEITLTKELDIAASDISITGKVSGVDTIKGVLNGKIKVTGNNVRLSLMEINGKEVTDSNTKSVVTIAGTGFNSSQVKYKANSIEGNWDNILCYTHENPTTVLFYNVFDGTNATSLIDFKGKLAKDPGENKHSRLIGNDFKGASETKEFIIIEEFEEGAKLDITQTEADFADAHEYGIRIKKPKTKISATIDLGYDWFNSTDKILKIALETDDSTDYSGLKISGGRNFKNKVEIYYLKDSGDGIKFTEEKNNAAGEAELEIRE